MTTRSQPYVPPYFAKYKVRGQTRADEQKTTQCVRSLCSLFAPCACVPIFGAVIQPVCLQDWLRLIARLVSVCLWDFLREGNGRGGFHTPVRGAVFVRNGAVTPGPSRECDITSFVTGRPKSARQSRDSTVAARRVQSVTIPSCWVSRECRSPGLRSPHFKNARLAVLLETSFHKFCHGFGCALDAAWMWLRCGSDVAQIWLGCDSDVALMWRRHVFRCGVVILAEVKGERFPVASFP